MSFLITTVLRASQEIAQKQSRRETQLTQESPDDRREAVGKTDNATIECASALTSGR